MPSASAALAISFNGEVRNECRRLAWFLSRTQAKVVIEAVHHYHYCHRIDAMIAAHVIGK